MFIDQTAARRIESAEAQLMRAMVNALAGTTRAPAAFVRELGAGAATFIRPGSPMNKVIGAGLDAPVDAAALATIEGAYRSAGEAVRIELATLADPHTCEQLTARGYRLLGFENVLVRALGDSAATAATGDIRIARVSDAAAVAAFRDTLVDAFAQGDATGVVVDTFTRDAIADAIADTLPTTSIVRYLAYLDGALAGAASMSVQGPIAMLAGSATLAPQRRRGVQAALLARRLADARTAGATLATITTAPGTQSQANVMKLGFALAYSRALLVLSS
jgi:hypothetical protein